MFTDLIERHRLTPGRLVHIGSTEALSVPDYYEAGYTDITVIDADPERIKSVRTRFPGVNAVETQDELASVGSNAHTFVINTPGHELALTQFIPWDSLQLLIVRTTAADNANGPSSYDLVTETAATRGFTEVDRWARGADLDVAFLKS